MKFASASTSGGRSCTSSRGGLSAVSESVVAAVTSSSLAPGLVAVGNGVATTSGTTGGVTGGKVGGSTGGKVGEELIGESVLSTSDARNHHTHTTACVVTKVGFLCQMSCTTTR